ncbi:MAG: relaxase/mobilization nuclease domain-containing protein [Oscillospiraceae bacterium]|nr:relaxase/mobilization nuclease domain-containing protein [Oscillospiraceae bacterium]
MPITKCEASKATPAKGIEYIMDPDKVIARGSQGFMSDNPEKMAKQMLQTMHLFGKGHDYNERKYYHAKVSFHPTDRPENGGVLTADRANRFATKYAKTLWSGREVVWAVQDHGSSIHIHFIVAACEQSTGRKLDARYAQYREWKDYANTLAAEYGLSTLDWRKATKEKRARERNPKEVECVTFSEVEMRKKNKNVWKDELRSIIDGAAAECSSMVEFRAALEKHGVVLTRCTEQTISYKLRDHKACRGDTLGGDYTLRAIQNALNHNAHARGPVQFDEIDFETRKKYRSWGRMAGMKREEIDMLCDELPHATWQEKQALWEKYKQLRDLFWSDYQIRKDNIQQKLDEAYQLRRKAKDAEWALNINNRRKSWGGIIFAGIYLHQYGGSEQYDACIEDLKRQQEKLRKEAQQFKRYSQATVDVLKAQNLPLDEYMDSLRIMQQMAEDVVQVGENSLEYWAKEYERRVYKLIPVPRSIMECLDDAETRSCATEGIQDKQPEDFTK